MQTEEFEDKIYNSWLTGQTEELLKLVDESDIIDIRPVALNAFVARFAVRTLVIDDAKVVSEAVGVDAHVWISPNYLRFVNPLEVITIVEPRNLFLPNAAPPVCCIGPISPGTPLTDLVFRTYEMLGGQNVTPLESDALSRDACSWVRRHPERLPTDTRPLKRVQPPVQAASLGVSS